jgi:hypothetical protein
MQRLEVISRFCLALASSVFLFMGGLMLPPLGVIFLPFVAQPILVFSMNYGVAAGLGLVFLAMLVLALFAGEELALIYAIFALMAGLLLKLLGRLKEIEYLVGGIAAVLFAAAASLLLYFFGSWAAMIQEFRRSISQQIASAMAMHEKMGFPSESLELLKEQSPQLIETMLQILPALVFLGLAFMVLIIFSFLSSLPGAPRRVAVGDQLARVESARAAGVGADRLRFLALCPWAGSGAGGGAECSPAASGMLFCSGARRDRFFLS